MQEIVSALVAVLGFKMDEFACLSLGLSLKSRYKKCDIERAFSAMEFSAELAEKARYGAVLVPSDFDKFVRASKAKTVSPPLPGPTGTSAARPITTARKYEILRRARMLRDTAEQEYNRMFGASFGQFMPDHLREQCRDRFTEGRISQAVILERSARSQTL